MPCKPRVRLFPIGVYFITICTNNRKCLFGEIVDGKMRLNETGSMAKQCWDAIPDHFPQILSDQFVVMPNHIHGIIFIVGSCPNPHPNPHPNPCPDTRSGNAITTNTSSATKPTYIASANIFKPTRLVGNQIRCIQFRRSSLQNINVYCRR